MARISPRCPVCQERLDGYIAIGDQATPSPGDVSICAWCARLLIFTDHQGSLRKATREEQEHHCQNPMVRGVLATLKEVRRKRRKGGVG